VRPQGPSSRTEKIESRASFISISRSRPARKPRSGPCRAGASAFSYESRAARRRPSLGTKPRGRTARRGQTSHEHDVVIFTTDIRPEPLPKMCEVLLAFFQQRRRFMAKSDTSSGQNGRTTVLLDCVSRLNTHTVELRTVRSARISWGTVVCSG
jgi:hypothetical protein